MRRCCSASLLESEVISVYLMRQLSWMYSCPYKDIRDYPADVVLHYLRSINPLEMWRSRVFRVTPSIHRLQCALTHNAQVELKTRINGIGPNRTIDGVSYDYIVLATEASAVASILERTPNGRMRSMRCSERYNTTPRVLLCTRTSL